MELPITLLLHREELLKAWQRSGEQIQLLKNGIFQVERGFDVELVGSATGHMSGRGQQATISDEKIENLIVAVKTPQTVAALRAIRNRLTSQTTMVLLQNGMGVHEEVSKALYPDHSVRPYCMLGIISHGINSRTPFSVTQAGSGTIRLGSLSTDNEPASANYIKHALQQAAALNLTIHSTKEILQLQWEKLAVNAVINPLTATMDCLNGRLLEDDMASSIGLLISEISAVIQALPELPDEAKLHFLPNRIDDSVRRQATNTAKNVSSMLQDVRAGKPTEIQYITGYIIRRAEELGVPCDRNTSLMELVLTRERR
ncbi:hypothetical protein MMC13_005873 [Lambiella insularis]|nr:hypothetical protein [Lambiella insularis]